MRQFLMASILLSPKSAASSAAVSQPADNRSRSVRPSLSAAGMTPAGNLRPTGARRRSKTSAVNAQRPKVVLTIRVNETGIPRGMPRSPDPSAKFPIEVL